MWSDCCTPLQQSAQAVLGRVRNRHCGAADSPLPSTHFLLL